MDLFQHRRVFVKQIRELAEFFGFETRNKYQIMDEQGQPLAFAAEQQKGILGFLFRQFLGHWRTFEIHFFDRNRQKLLTARQPFRIFFQRLEVLDTNGRSLGVIRQRFSILSKKFDIDNSQGQPLLKVSSPLFRIWTFKFMRNGREMARIEKKWGGLLTEAFSDKDTFLVDYSAQELHEDERKLILVAALFIDLRYFENKGGGPLALGDF